MRRSSICKLIFILLLLGIAVGGCKKQEKNEFLPEAKNDYTFTVIGE